MTLEQQVCSLELAQKLKELGVKQESLFHWSRGDDHGGLEVRYRQYVSDKDGEPVEHCSAFTVAELGQILPERENIVTMFLGNGSCQIAFQESLQLEMGEMQSSRWGAAGQCILADTEADARAKMLIYLLENKLLTM
jgi:hypothetical protein